MLTALARAGLDTGMGAAVPLLGGRTNHVFRCGDLVAKLFARDAGNLIFPNSAADEYTCLTALCGSGLAPDPVALLSEDGVEILVYRYIAGTRWQCDPVPVAHLLGQVHARKINGLPARSLLPADLARQGRDLLDGTGQRGRDLLALRPQMPEALACVATVTHGDVTASNIVVAQGRLRLIDWQCPSISDPAADLAGFLSPTMQTLYGPGPLHPSDRAAFLGAYPDPAVVCRYLAYAPLFHWRMACYCLQQVTLGHGEYADGLNAELQCLEQGPTTVPA